MKFVASFVLAAIFACCVAAAPVATNVYLLSYTPAPPNNPLKGFMPYTGSYTTFPYSMEWNYLPLRSLMTGPTNFNWSSLETLLSNDVKRGHQTIFRVYLDYPTLPTGIPQYLLDAGLITYTYDDYGNDGISVCPDSRKPAVRSDANEFIAALGARYDGDVRIGFIGSGYSVLGGMAYLPGDRVVCLSYLAERSTGGVHKCVSSNEAAGPLARSKP